MALKLLANNNAKSVLGSGISASATVLTVSSGMGKLFPTPNPGISYFKLTITDSATKTINEIVHVTSVSGDVMTVQRGQEGTIARTWSTNDIVANMMTAGTFYACLQTANNLSEIKDVGADAQGEARDNIGLKDAALRDVGNDDDQLPDMSFFTSSLSGNGWQKLPSGLIIQWGQVLSNASGFAPWTYPIPFPTACFQVYTTTFVAGSTNNFTVTIIGNPSLTGTTAGCYVNGVQSSIVGQVGVRYLAIGY